MRTTLVLFASLAACNSTVSGNRTKDGGGPDAPQRCGDGVKSGNEQCDGTDLGSATCASATAAGWVGVLSCTSSCELNVAGCNPPATTWNTLTDTSKWSAFDISTLFPGAKGFISSVFDGRYLYFLPNNNGAIDGIVARFDTQGGFGASGSWETFDVSTVNGGAKGFEGGAFDGRYLYLVPYNNGAYDGLFVRYDTQGTFGDAASWTTFDLTSVDPNAKGYVFASYDGRYLYFAPHYNGAYDGDVARYDTQGGFTDATSWSTFDVSAVNASCKGFLGTIFDGRYIYLVPYYTGAAYDGVVARYDTQSTTGFANVASWSAFDIASTNGNAVGFRSTAFDGRYIYFTQYYDGAVPAYGGFVSRFDTQGSFTAPGSWASFNIGSVNANASGFIGTQFDGRYVYFIPYYSQTVMYDGIVARYDTQGAGFGTAASWSTFDVSAVNGGAKGFQGGGFDGEFIYLAPSNNGTAPSSIIARFDAKSPGWLPLGWNRTFN
ncbi:MAG TPA: hypothetical protein VLX92_19885 [Kofleriaceae bacterium]|nr:hypothetical protein [Kofleriaceae bacterium]